MQLFTSLSQMGAFLASDLKAHLQARNRTLYEDDMGPVIGSKSDNAIMLGLKTPVHSIYAFQEIAQQRRSIVFTPDDRNIKSLRFFKETLAGNSIRMERCY